MEWLDKSIEQQHLLVDIATNQSVSEMKLRAEGFLEALYYVREFIITSREY